jgi:hypothetical protein
MVSSGTTKPYYSINYHSKNTENLDCLPLEQNFFVRDLRIFVKMFVRLSWKALPGTSTLA